MKGSIFFAVIFACFISCKDNQNEINISKKEALEIAKRYNISGDSVEISFHTYIYPKSSIAYEKGKRKLLYWKIEKKCNGCGIIQVDAESGNVFTTGKYNYQY
jgi:hypothetical protein